MSSIHPLLHPSTYLTGLKYFFIYHFLTTHIGRLAQTAGPSMLPTINVRGNYVCIDHRFRRGRGVKVGDVVDYQHPMVAGAGAVKRVVGMPGDFVVSERGKTEGQGDEGEGARMIQVPEGHCWLLGDNPPFSRDSRTYGAVPLALIKGKVIATVWPWSDMGWIRNNVQRLEE